MMEVYSQKRFFHPGCFVKQERAFAIRNQNLMRKFKVDSDLLISRILKKENVRKIIYHANLLYFCSPIINLLAKTSHLSPEVK